VSICERVLELFLRAKAPVLCRYLDGKYQRTTGQITTTITPVRKRKDIVQPIHTQSPTNLRCLGDAMSWMRDEGVVHTIQRTDEGKAEEQHAR
jgi:hypothetical protein